MDKSELASDTRRTEALQNLFGHAAAFLLIGVVAGGIDLVDGARGGTVLGLDWAYWLLIPWSVLFAIHVIGFFSRASAHRPIEPPSTLMDFEEDESERMRHLVTH